MTRKQDESLGGIGKRVSFRNEAGLLSRYICKYKVSYINVASFLKAITVEAEKQPLLGNAHTQH
jgi:hypothetical protein